MIALALSINYYECYCFQDSVKADALKLVGIYLDEQVSSHLREYFMTEINEINSVPKVFTFFFSACFFQSCVFLFFFKSVINYLHLHNVYSV